MSLSDDAALVIDNEQGADALVVTDSIDSLLEVSHYLNFLLQLYKIKSNLNFYHGVLGFWGFGFYFLFSHAILIC